MKPIERIGPLNARCPDQPTGEPEGFVERELSLALESLTKRLPVDEGRHVVQEKRPTLRRVSPRDVHHTQDVAVLEAAEDLELADDLLRVGASDELRAQDLDGHASVVPEVPREVHGRPLAVIQLALDQVAVVELRREQQGLGHSGGVETIDHTGSTAPPKDPKWPGAYPPGPSAESREPRAENAP